MSAERPVTAIDAIAAVTGCSKPAILDAAKVCNLPIFGGYIGRPARKLPLAFYEEIHALDAMHGAQAQRHARA